MAIQFARIEIVGRSTGGNACCKGAYNARSKVADEKTGEVYNFQKKGDNAYHKILLPEYADKKFNSISEFMNEVERCEKRKDSQLLKDIVLALPDDKELDLKDRIEITNRLIEKRGWVKEGLGVQVDIHAPHDGEKNWHAHLLVTTRRFTKDGLTFGAKATDLNPEFKKAGNKAYVVPEAEQIHEELKDIINDYFKENGLKNRVDAIGKSSQEHIGPVRMRSVMNEAVYRNEERKEANIKHLNSGARLLENVTRHLSVFNRADLERAVKIIPEASIRDKLVENAMKSNSLISLYDESGNNTGYFSTTEIRDEEEKLLRLSGYIAGSKNVISIGGAEVTRQLIQEASKSLSEEQSAALSHLLLDDSGIRILRGRAGTGKSYVLGHVQKIATSLGVNVIGLAPTHKARGELANKGYEQNDTIKGMLFKLNNSRLYLPKGSLLVVDEAGMVGNDDYKELLRVASGRKCNVILAGDERQLASVQRGGMYEVFSDRYGSSTILNIQRQKNAWGRGVAMAFSNGEVKSGIAILQANNKIIESSTKDASMQNLLSDWSKSNESLNDRWIIAVTNRDVNALNHGARQYLKLSGDLRGEEISVAGSHYMKGDRILIKDTNKGLGLVNGDFATVVHASKERFVISMEGARGGGNENGVTNDNKKLVEFNPSAYSGFKHGYATTVFKAQAASILEVFVFHDGFAGIRNSYVALSRNVRDLKLYINNQATKSVAHLVKQLGHDPEIGSSLSYLTSADLESRAVALEPEKEQGIFSSMLSNALDFTKNKITAFNDKHFVDNAYYKYEVPQLNKARVEDVLDMVASQMQVEAVGSEIALEERAVVGGNSINITAGITNTNNLANPHKVKQTAKERFYAKADYARNSTSSLQRQAEWDMEAERLRSEVKYKTEAIARGLLGEPNKQLSDGKTLRFGEHGKIAVRISGERMGSWFDFSADKGGDMFALVQDKQGCDFKGAAEYLRQSVGIEASTNNHIKLVHDHRNKDLTEKYIKAKVEEERVANAKAEQAKKLYSRAREIGSRSIACRYLTEHRGLDLANSTSINVLSNDIKTTGVYVASEKGSSEKGKYLPVLVAFARDSEGNVTGGQQIFLDKTNANKADIAVPKKSFGKIAGAFVNVGNVISKGGQQQFEKNATNVISVQADKITIIAEGLETAMSVRQGLNEHSKNNNEVKVLCSLGISNIKNYHLTPGEKIIIAADNDGVDSNTSKTIENAKLALEKNGAFVEVVRPSKDGDFNDVLKSDGSKVISDAFKPALERHAARTVEEYFGKDGIDSKLDTNDKSNLAYIEKYALPQNIIVDAYRKSALSGKVELDYSRKSLEMAVSHYNDNKELLGEAQKWGYEKTENDTIKALVGMDSNETAKYITDIRNNHLETYFAINLKNFSTKKYTFNYEEQKALITKEQDFLQRTYESANITGSYHDYGKSFGLMAAGKEISSDPSKLDKFLEHCTTIKENNILSEHQLCTWMAFSPNISMLLKDAATTIERHHLKTIPAELAQMREEAVSIDGAFDSIEKEQNKLADQHGKIEYLAFEKELLDKCELAHTQREDHSLGDLKYIANRALDTGAKTKEELLADLQQVTDLKEAHTKLDTDIEVHHINSTLDNSAIQKQEAKAPEEILSIITKEQEFLSGLHGNIKYPAVHNLALLDKCKLAHKQKEDNVLHDLKAVAYQSLASGAKSENELVSDLQRVTDLKEAHTNLDKDIEAHHINSTLDNSAIQKQEAKSPEEILSIITREQEFLSGLHGNIKYPEEHQALLAKCEIAHEQKESNSLDNLKEIAKLSLISGAKTKEKLVSDLQQVTDLKAAHVKLDKDMESHHINSNLNKLSKEKQAATNTKEAINAITKEQQFLKGLHGNIKYPEHHDKQLMNSISTANAIHKGGALDDLNRAAEIIGGTKFTRDNSITDIIKNCNDPVDAHKTLIKEYQDHFLGQVHKCLDTIDSKGHITLDEHKFSCPLKLMEHITDKHTHEYVPHKQLQQLHTNTIEHHKEPSRGMELDF